MYESLISVIVPIYNVEQYLNQCVESIVNQTYKNLEIILIDDGSPDSCPKLCNEWALRDSRIKVAHKNNGGLSDARNFGLKESTGEYICFVDSDDYISKYMIEALYTVLKKDSSDICECNYELFYDSQVIKDVYFDINSKYFLKRDALMHLFKEDIFKHVAWNKLYSKNILKDLYFEKGKLHEDLFFTYLAFNKSKQISKIDGKYYYYRQRFNSIMGSKFSIRNLDALEARKKHLDFVKGNYPDMLELLENRFLGSCLYFMQLAIKTKDKSLIKQTKNIIKPLFYDVNKNRMNKFNFKQELWYRMASISLISCCKIRNKLKIGC